MALRSPPGGPHLFVDQVNGLDTNDGLSWGRAKQTLGAVLAATPNGALIDGAAGNYLPNATLPFNGHLVRGPLMHGGDSSKGMVIQHNFNGDLVSFAAGSQGGGIENAYLNQSSNGLTGAAIKAASTAGSPSGYLSFRNLVLSGATGFERNVWLDGSANAIGIRSVFFENCDFFGTFLTSQNAGEPNACTENVRIDSGVHVYFTACDVVQAPAAQTQGVKIYGALSEDIFWNGCKLLGNWYTAAAGNGVLFAGRCTGPIVCAAGSTNNKFYGIIDPNVSWVNNGGNGNAVIGGASTGVRVRKTAATSTTSATPIAIPFDAEDFDQPQTTQHDNVTNNSRLVCRAEGLYRIYGALVYQASTVGERAIMFRVNGINWVGGDVDSANTTAADQTVMSASTSWHLAVGDYVECWAQQVSGGALTVDVSSTSVGIPTHFGMERVA